MARPKSNKVLVRMRVYLPEDLATRIELHLWSELEETVPQGAKQAFWTKLVKEYFEQLDRVKGEVA